MPQSRRLAGEAGRSSDCTLAAAAEAAGVSVRTLSKWVRRYREEGEYGLLDRLSVPRSVPGRTPEERVAVISALRRLEMTAAEIAETLAVVFGGRCARSIHPKIRRFGLSWRPWFASSRTRTAAGARSGREKGRD